MFAASVAHLLLSPGTGSTSCWTFDLVLLAILIILQNALGFKVRRSKLSLDLLTTEAAQFLIFLKFSEVVFPALNSLKDNRLNLMASRVVALTHGWHLPLSVRLGVYKLIVCLFVSRRQRPEGLQSGDRLPMSIESVFFTF